VTQLLAEEDGPFDAVVRVRRALGDGQLGELMDCSHCLSMWVAAPLTFTVTRRPAGGAAAATRRGALHAVTAR
jgi:hypothetical protein